MNRHVTTGRWRLGLALSLNTAFLWGILPIALKIVLESLDAYTLTWFRYLIATAVLAVFVMKRSALPPLHKLKGAVPGLLIVTSIGLCGNYILYVLGLDYLSPSTATVVIQLAPIFMLLGSLILFKERFSILQWTGFVILLTGLFLFLNDRIMELLYQLTDYTIGVLLIVASAIFWAVYALTQKQLLNTFSSDTIMLCIYFSGMVLFFPFARPSELSQLDTTHLILLLFCAFNTLIAYGSFAESLNHLEASRISMILAIIPIITLIGVKFCSVLFPEFVEPEHFNAPSIAGALLVVAGSMLCALTRNKDTEIRGVYNRKLT